MAKKVDKNYIPEESVEQYLGGINIDTPRMRRLEKKVRKFRDYGDLNDLKSLEKISISPNININKEDFHTLDNAFYEYKKSDDFRDRVHELKSKAFSENNKFEKALKDAAYKRKLDSYAVNELIYELDYGERPSNALLRVAPPSYFNTQEKINFKHNKHDIKNFLSQYAKENASFSEAHNTLSDFKSGETFKDSNNTEEQEKYMQLYTDNLEKDVKDTVDYFNALYNTKRARRGVRRINKYAEDVIHSNPEQYYYDTMNDMYIYDIDVKNESSDIGIKKGSQITIGSIGDKKHTRKGTLAHEIAHGRKPFNYRNYRIEGKHEDSPYYNNDYSLLREKHKRWLKSEVPWRMYEDRPSGYNHDIEISEAFSDLAQLRQDLYDAGIVDGTKRRYRNKDIKAMRESSEFNSRYLDYHTNNNRVRKALNRIWANGGDMSNGENVESDKSTPNKENSYQSQFMFKPESSYTESSTPAEKIIALMQQPTIPNRTQKVNPFGFADITSSIIDGAQYLYYDSPINRSYYKDDNNRYYMYDGEPLNTEYLTEVSHEDIKKLLPKRDYIGGSKRNVGLTVINKIPGLKDEILKLSKTYDISPDVFTQRLINEGFLQDLAKEYNIASATDQKKYPWKDILNYQVNGYNELGLDTFGDHLKAGDLNLRRKIDYTDIYNANEDDTGNVYNSGVFNNAYDALEAKAAMIEYFTKIGKSKGYTGSDLDAWVNAAYNMGEHNSKLNDINFVRKRYGFQPYYQTNTNSFGGRINKFFNGGDTINTRDNTQVVEEPASSNPYKYSTLKMPHDRTAMLNRQKPFYVTDENGNFVKGADGKVIPNVLGNILNTQLQPLRDIEGKDYYAPSSPHIGESNKGEQPTSYVTRQYLLNWYNSPATIAIIKKEAETNSTNVFQDIPYTDENGNTLMYSPTPEESVALRSRLASAVPEYKDVPMNNNVMAYYRPESSFTKAPSLNGKVFEVTQDVNGRNMYLGPSIQYGDNESENSTSWIPLHEQNHAFQHQLLPSYFNDTDSGREHDELKSEQHSYLMALRAALGLNPEKRDYTKEDAQQMIEALQNVGGGSAGPNKLLKIINNNAGVLAHMLNTWAAADDPQKNKRDILRSMPDYELDAYDSFGDSTFKSIAKRNAKILSRT